MKWGKGISKNMAASCLPIFSLLVFGLATTTQAQCVKYNGIVGLGGQRVVTSGINSTTTAIKTYPNSTISVYATGTTNLSSIFSDSTCTTPKANPFGAAIDASYSFYISATTVDLRFSGSGSGIVTPFTVSGVTIAASTPAGAAGGELAGTYPNPTVITGTGPSQIVRLTAGSKLPAVDGSLLTNIGGSVGSLAFTFGATDLWDNTYWFAQSGFHQHSSMARALFYTSATSVSISVFCNGTPDASTAIQVWVDGVVYASPLVPLANANTIVQSLPTGNKLVAIIGGVQGPTAGSAPTGVYLTGATFNIITTILSPQQTDRVVVYGDSISQGGGGSPNIATAWPTYYRTMTDRSVVLEAASGRSLFTDCDTAPHCTTFVTNEVTPANPTTLWIEIGTNDYQGVQSAANFGTAYANLLDTVHSQMPGVVVYCQTPILKTSGLAEGVNAFGNILEDYREQIRTVVKPRMSFARIVEGPDILTQSDLVDGIHPNDTGNKKFAYYVYRALSGWKERDGNPADVPDLTTTENVVWANTVNVAVSTNSLTKNAGPGAYNAGGTSTKALLFNAQSDSWIRWTVTEINTSRVVGLEKTHIGANFPEILFAHSPAADGTLLLFESGAGVFSGATVLQTGDILQMRIRPPKLYYERIRNGVTTLIRVSPQAIIPSMFPLFVDVSMFEIGSTVTNMQIHGILQ